MRGTGIDTPRLQNFFFFFLCVVAALPSSSARLHPKPASAGLRKQKRIEAIPAKKIIASSGNRTRAARVAGEHSTTEPTMLDEMWQLHESTYSCFGGKAESKYLRSR